METAIDARQAFAALQEVVGGQISQLLGDIAAKNAFITQLQEENHSLIERITALEQNHGALSHVHENGATKGGADLKNYPLPVPSSPPPRKIRDNPQA